ncbi:alpha/beta hydrolase [Ichthyenterobacterium sp. W332]|uniref:Alpha/beta hydrolase n=1 Tax=Microcosmobacter mediterraneus TaxID=3075607 RepID=A0ABU2YK84_9FLAO|nr:alpha/beta hydrolase [Ichthyenterobacterium sp. W332]MDT0558579.1 alpha/beta hydrolase [Ichthyenterobacterium sp. W332]
MIKQHKGIKIFYEDEGKGPVVLLLHGFLETSAMWKEIKSEIIKTNRVVTVDLLGHGKTESLSYVHSMDDMADAVFTVINHLNITKFNAIGHSMGGYVALAMAEKQPSYFEGLCLMNSSFEADTDDRKQIRRRAIAMAKVNYKSLITLSFANLFAPESTVNFKKAYDDALVIALQTSVQGYIAAQEGMLLRPNRFKTFKTIKGKKSIIIGKKDTIIDNDLIKFLIEKTDIEMLELAQGHMSHIEDLKNLLTYLIHYIEK